MNKACICLLAIPISFVSFVYAQQTVDVSIAYSSQISWNVQTGVHYLVQSTTNLMFGEWKTLAPMYVGNKSTNIYADSSRQPVETYRVITTTNTYCNEQHPALGAWRGTAFSDYYYFNPDGTVTGSVYQWKMSGTWLPFSTNTFVFAVYDRDDGGQIHQALINPIIGTVHDGTNIDFFVDNTWWFDYANRIP